MITTKIQPEVYNWTRAKWSSTSQVHAAFLAVGIDFVILKFLFGYRFGYLLPACGVHGPMASQLFSLNNSPIYLLIIPYHFLSYDPMY